MGSLSYRFNVGPLLKKKEKETNDEKNTENSGSDQIEDEIESSSSDETVKIKEVQKKLKESEESKKVLMKEYLKCEMELRKYTEETEKLKTEVKDLKAILKLKKQLDVNKKDSSGSDVFNNDKVDPRRKPNHQSSPNKRYFKEREYNCMECPFQGTEQKELSNHMNLKHRKDPVFDGAIKCRICGEGFRAKWDLMNHRKNKHIENVAPCRNNIENKCPYADYMCWWNHNEERGENIKCFICSKSFESKIDMMRHRKIEHKEMVRTCSQFLQNMCRFKNDSCWFKHEKETKKDNDIDSQNEDMDENIEEVFQKVSEDLLVLCFDTFSLSDIIVSEKGISLLAALCEDVIF